MGENMALSLNLKSMLGARPSGRSAGEAELEMPATPQVKMGSPSPGYDPLASASMMEQLRTAAAEKRPPPRAPVTGPPPAAKPDQIRRPPPPTLVGPAPLVPFPFT